MKTVRPVVSALAFASLVHVAAAATPDRTDPPDQPYVSTFAGSGALGIDDGPGPQATFVAPAGIAYASDGRLFVADRDAQRIRVVSQSGNVTTVAGAAPLVPLGIAAPGGYRDGPASQALFNMPSAVLPQPDGSVLVADTYNHCIRSIRAGNVSTFAGNGIAGAVDGSRSAARFVRPIALVRDGSGNVYVADPPVGVRRIDGRGDVTTLQFHESRAIVALAWTADAPRSLLVASVSKIERIDLATLGVDRDFPLEFSFLGQPSAGNKPILREGSTNAGPVAALAAFATNDFIFTDALDSTVRLGQTEESKDLILDYTRALTAIPPENSSDGIAGFADGPGSSALVDEPIGVAISPSGTVAIADTGNRRIRIFSAFDRRTHLTTDEAHAELPRAPDPHEYRIAIVGSSYVWWDQSWHDSIAGRVQDELAAGNHGTRNPRVYPLMRLGINTPGALSFIDGELSDGLFDMIVLDFSTYGQMGGEPSGAGSFPSGWQASYQTGLTKTYDMLRANGIPFLVVNMPGAPDFPDEFAYFRIPKGLPEDHADTGVQNQPANVQHYHDEIASVLQRSDAPTLDLWPTFVSAYAAPKRVPLYNTWDHHLSRFGRSIVADGIANRILQMQPWTGPRKLSQ